MIDNSNALYPSSNLVFSNCYGTRFFLTTMLFVLQSRYNWWTTNAGKMLLIITVIVVVAIVIVAAVMMPP